MNQTESVSFPGFNTPLVAGGSRSLGPRDAKLSARLQPAGLPAMISLEEVLVVDERSNLRPSHVIESRLTRLLGYSAPPISMLLMRTILRTR